MNAHDPVRRVVNYPAYIVVDKRISDGKLSAVWAAPCDAPSDDSCVRRIYHPKELIVIRLRGEAVLMWIVFDYDHDILLDLRGAQYHPPRWPNAVASWGVPMTYGFIPSDRDLDGIVNILYRPDIVGVGRAAGVVSAIRGTGAGAEKGMRALFDADCDVEIYAPIHVVCCHINRLLKYVRIKLAEKTIDIVPPYEVLLEDADLDNAEAIYVGNRLIPKPLGGYS